MASTRFGRSWALVLVLTGSSRPQVKGRIVLRASDRIKGELERLG